MAELAASAPVAARHRALARIGRRELLTGAALLFVLWYFLVPADWGQTSQLALTKAFAHGTPSIDRTRDNADPIWGATGDIGTWRGHVYSDKAPGFALAATPVFLGVRATGVRTTGNPRRIVWLLGLFAGVLPALAVCLLVGRVAEGIEPGTGTATAIVLALGTMLETTGTFSSHALAALLCFGAFVLVRAARQREHASGLVFAAGLAAGYASITEYPDALVLAILAVAVAAGRERLRRTALYAAGACLGLAPLLAYDRWAFGSVFRYSRSHEVLTTEHNNVQHGLGGVGWPSAHRALTILFDHRMGLLVQSPVLVLALAGLVLLARRGHRFEALVCGAVVVAHLVYLSGFFDPWGGRSSGPRYLIPALPFLALGLPPLLRRIPRVVLAAGVVSIGIHALIRVTGDRIWPDQALLTRLRHRELLPAAFNPVPAEHPLLNVLPWCAALALVLVLLVTDPGLRRRAVD